MRQRQHGLDRAANLLEERGWCQDDYEDDQGHVSLATAVGIIYMDKSPALMHKEEDDHLDEILQPVATVLGIEVTELTAWEETEGRTVGEVLAALRAGASLASRGPGEGIGVTL